MNGSLGTVCEHKLQVDRDRALGIVRFTHGQQPSEAVLELTMLEITELLWVGRKPVDEWLASVHEYERCSKLTPTA